MKKGNGFRLMWLLFGALFSIACTRNGEGGDAGTTVGGSGNYVLSFALVKDGAEYAATIVDDRICMSVPYNVSLDGAEAVCRLSEYAAIRPDPAEIVAWDEEWRFLVTSGDGSDRVYHYRTEHLEIETEGDIVLNTQAEVDAFAATGVSVIKGNLMVGTDGVGGIASLKGLEHLKEICGTLMVGDAYGGTTLSGLEGLQRVGNVEVGSSVAVSGVQTLVEVSFPSLEEVTGDFVVCSVSVEQVSVPVLMRVEGDFRVCADRLGAVVSDKIEEVGGTLMLHGTSLPDGAETDRTAPCDFFYFPMLKTAGGVDLAWFDQLVNLDYTFPLLERTGGISYAHLSAMAAFTFPQLTETGELSVSDCGAMGVVSLPRLTASGTISVSASPSIYRVECPVLEHVAGDLTLDALPSIGGLEIFPSLKRIAGVLTLRGMSGFSGSLDLSKIEITGSDAGVVLEGGTLLSLSSITGPDTFDGVLTISGTGAGGALRRIPEIEGYAKVGKFELVSMPQVNDVSIPGLEQAGDLSVRSVGGSASSFFMEFGSLVEVTGTLSCESNGKNGLASCEIHFPKLERVGERLDLYTNAACLTRIGFPSLAEVGSNAGTPPEGDSDYALRVVPAGCAEGFELPRLRIVRGNALLQTWTTLMNKITSISAPLLTTVTGNLTIGYVKGSSSTYRCSTLTRLDFPSLMDTQSVRIGMLTELTDFSSFAGVVSALDGSGWTVTGCGYNPSFDDMVAGRYKTE